MQIVKAVLPYICFGAELWFFVWVLWRQRRRKITVISYALRGLEDTYPHEPIRTYCIYRDKESGRFSLRDVDKGAYSVFASDEGITWCWGWKQEDVDALVVSYTLR